MDSPHLAFEEYGKVLADLATVNSWTLAARPTLLFLKSAVGARPRFSVLDVGFGRGDMLCQIAAWAVRNGKEVELHGVDLNQKSLASALEATAGLPVQLHVGDYKDLPGPFDCVVSSLVAHHMGDSELHDFIGYMEGHARLGWLINDLHRHAFAYLGYPWLARLLRVHRIVREDGQLSIARSFRSADWATILDGAGLPPGAATIARHFPFRLCVERLR
ncbi:methyltransferase domain-containing protein [Sphingomonas ginkgonis]|uniref:Methyltransferase domain-containing protein n=2 Tax=Sphingomonas ginkgonis TaxID=2315330 RepID=A0A429VE17_9SPHN|nr:methyltransferase domain-containing protein [Sphingomonas ginkgonis]